MHEISSSCKTVLHLKIDQMDLLEKTMAYEAASLSANTLRTYKSMFQKFCAFCEANKLSYLPASSETIALYLSSIGKDVSFSTLDSTVASIEKAHEKSNLSILGDKSIYERVRKGIRRIHKNNQSTKQAPPLTVLDLKGACCRLLKGVKNIRDRSIITLCFFGAFRRSELVSLNLENIEFTDNGIVVDLMQSKTQDTKQKIYISYAKDNDICPVKALKSWLDISGITEGAIFRSLFKNGSVSGRLSGHAVSNIIKDHFGMNYSGHSARRGLVTASAEKGTPIHIIKKHSRHKSADMVLRYVEEGQGFSNSSVSVLGV
jgi:hypothetical protein